MNAGLVLALLILAAAALALIWPLVRREIRAASGSDMPHPRMTAGERWPDEPWCPGCGFSNGGTDPCTLCGYEEP